MDDVEQSRRSGKLVLRRTIEPGNIEERFGPLLEEVVEKLQSLGVEAERRCSVKDIVLEYLHNIGLHRPGGPLSPAPATIEIREAGDAVAVTMEGTGSSSDIRRMRRIVEELAELSNDEIWAELSRRSFAEKPFETPGAGLGLWTIAALSSRARLQFQSENRRGTAHFSLTSSV